jgi:hypothetical protein
MTKAKRHHIVPQFILKQFSDEKGLVRVYDKLTGKDFKSGINNVFLENDYYNFNIKYLKNPRINKIFQQKKPELINIIMQKNKNKGGEKISLEEATGIAEEMINNSYFSIEGSLSGIETTCSEVIKKVVREGVIESLSESEIDLLRIFIVTQRLRGSEGAHLIDHSQKKAMNIFPKHAMEDYSEEMTRLQFYGVIIPQLIPQLNITLALCTRPYLIRADADKSFCISDHPVTLYNKNTAPYGNLGYASPGIEVYMPISPGFTVAFISNTTQNYELPTTEFLNILQMRFSDKQIIFFDNISVDLLSEYCKNSSADFIKTDIVPTATGYYEIKRHIFE